MTIQKSLNYGRFVKDEHNRDVGNITKLIQSMKEYGWLDAYPMYCIQGEGGKLIIKDGNHRFMAATFLKIPVQFVVCDNANVSIPQINDCQKNWNLNDYLTHYVCAGRKDYVELDSYINATGISVTSAVSLFSGNGGEYNCGYVASFKNGTFKARKSALQEQIAKAIKVMSQHITFSRNSSLIKALVKLCKVSAFDIDYFLNRVKQNPSRFKKQATCDDYIVAVEKIYNYHAPIQSQIPLAHLCKQANAI